jgi:excisionase family DNA binding protein
MAMITTQEAAELLGVSVRRVTALIKSGKIPSERFGRAHVINEDDLKLVAERKVGRPRNTKAGDNQKSRVVGK